MPCGGVYGNSINRSFSVVLARRRGLGISSLAVLKSAGKLETAYWIGVSRANSRARRNREGGSGETDRRVLVVL